MEAESGDRRVWRLSSVLSFHPEMDLVVPVAGRNELGILLQVGVLCSHMVAAIAYWAKSSAIHEDKALLILCAGRR